MMSKASEDDYCYELNSPVDIPKASGFLWNDQMMIQATCRGYAVAQFMQPEPASYSHAPFLEAKTFMQPEQPFYAQHPGRFVYVKDESNKEIFSAPYEPVRKLPDTYLFSVGKSKIIWKAIYNGIELVMTLGLPVDRPLELWKVRVINHSKDKRKLSIYPYFPVGYMSWMNQSGEYNEALNAIVCSSITPYQKYQDYYKNINLKDKTFLLADTRPTSWEVNQDAFEGEGGLASPSALSNDLLSKGDARYEMPTCAMQYQMTLAPDEEREYRFIFGPAKNEEEIAQIRQKYFAAKNEKGEDGFASAEVKYEKYISEGQGCIQIQTPDPSFDEFVNTWLPRQIYYHGKTNRLSTDPQTRNFLQDYMGLSYIKPEMTRAAFLHALKQQRKSGQMPDGILLYKEAELKYINQVPHSDHCVWLPMCLKPYLDETNDFEILKEEIPFSDSEETASVLEHINLAMDWLIYDRDERGLNYIHQGDWCDPMNMVGYKGKGVSAWLTMASAYTFNCWAGICEDSGYPDSAHKYRTEAQKTNEAINQYFWDGEWFARGITDDNVLFGISTDPEGRIFLNPQGWSILCGAADGTKQSSILKAVSDQLETPYGLEKLAPPYAAMREDVGRVTQKYMGTAENGSVYNHAVAFYIYALYHIGQKENAFRLLRKMIPGPDREDIVKRGQLPVFIPNYYRGAYHIYPRTAGRSSNLINTGTIPWFYRCLVDGLFGLQGTPDGLKINPQLPAEWNEAQVIRTFRGAQLHIKIERTSEVQITEVYAGDSVVPGGIIKDIKPGQVYDVLVKIPATA